MNRHMVEEAGSRFLELASSFGRLHADTLTGLADATAKTPFGPVFAINASLARMANDGIETLATRAGGTTVEAPAPVSTPVPAPKPPAPVVAKPAPRPVVVKAPAPEKATPEKAPAPEKVERPALKVVDAPAFKAKETPKPKETAKADAPAPFEVHTKHATSIGDFDEPDIADVLLDDALIEDVVARVERKPVALADKDDLTLINGIGATTAKKLNGIGIESFAQIADMTEADFTELLASLDIKTIRFSPGVWIGEAKTRMAAKG